MAATTTKAISEGGYATAAWVGLAKNETGTAVDIGALRGDKTVEIKVNNADGDSVTIQGSIDKLSWYTLRGDDFVDNEEFRVPLSAIAVSSMYKIVENPRYIRPVVSNAGGGAADFDVRVGASARL